MPRFDVVDVYVARSQDASDRDRVGAADHCAAKVTNLHRRHFPLTFLHSNNTSKLISRLIPHSSLSWKGLDVASLANKDNLTRLGTEAWNGWSVMTVLFTVLGVTVLGKGIAIIPAK
jgi:hypothetical protein